MEDGFECEFNRQRKAGESLKGIQVGSGLPKRFLDKDSQGCLHRL